MNQIDYEKIIKTAKKFFETESEAVEWLNTPSEVFENQKPINHDYHAILAELHKIKN